jgi:hypothetical protein
MAMGNIQSVSGRQDGKASRSLTPVPEKLGKLLKLVNIVPPELELPNIAEMITGVSAWVADGTLMRELAGKFKTLPDLLSVYIWLGEERLFSILDGTSNDKAVEDYLRSEGESEDDHGWSEKEWLDHKPSPYYLAAINYTYVRESREMLRDIARHAKSHSYYISSLPKTRLSLSHGSISIDSHGRLNYSPPPFIKAIEGVEAARIRECEVCDQLFWAGRLDQKTCTTKCAKVLRTRRWRQNYQTKYKLTRIAKEEKPKKAKDKVKQGKARA